MISVRMSTIHGRGVFADRNVLAGEYISEYLGEHISNEECDRRLGSDEFTMMFVLSETVVVDGARGGNETAFINHSCSPNVEAEVDEEEGKIWIRAMRDILEGEELKLDYGFERDGTEQDGEFVCRCGSENCRGTMLSP